MTLSAADAVAYGLADQVITQRSGRSYRLNSAA
jgi:ATP-dependent protease ClpP protease subunit